jgi:hypothetical protein
MDDTYDDRGPSASCGPLPGQPRPRQWGIGVVSAFDATDFHDPVVDAASARQPVPIDRHRKRSGWTPLAARGNVAFMQAISIATSVRRPRLSRSGVPFSMSCSRAKRPERHAGSVERLCDGHLQ